MDKTDKARRIWQTVKVIPSGKVASYGKVADLAGLPGRARFVSKALKCAPDNEQLPWHRVLRSSGQIAFKSDSPLACQQADLLNREGVTVRNQRVDMQRFAWQPELSEILAKLEY